MTVKIQTLDDIRELRGKPTYTLPDEQQSWLRDLSSSLITVRSETTRMAQKRLPVHRSAQYKAAYSNAVKILKENFGASEELAREYVGQFATTAREPDFWERPAASAQQGDGDLASVLAGCFPDSSVRVERHGTMISVILSGSGAESDSRDLRELCKAVKLSSAKDCDFPSLTPQGGTYTVKVQQDLYNAVWTKHQESPKGLAGVLQSNGMSR